MDSSGRSQPTQRECPPSGLELAQQRLRVALQDHLTVEAEAAVLTGQRTVAGEEIEERALPGRQARAQTADHFGAVHAGHVIVDEHHVGADEVALGRGARRVRRDDEAGGLEHIDGGAQVRDAVVDVHDANADGLHDGYCVRLDPARS